MFYCDIYNDATELGNSTVFNVKLIKYFARHKLKISLQELSKTRYIVYLDSKTLIIFITLQLQSS